jgi:hypothetical protein
MKHRLKYLQTSLAARCVAVVCAACVLLHGVPVGSGQPTGRVGTAELSPEADRAIENGLQYLSKTQNPDGSWGSQHQPAITGLVLMSFMLKGHFPKHGPHGAMLDKAVRYLLAKAKEGGGYFGTNMYNHGLATLALSEVWGMSDRAEIRDALKQAVEVIRKAQSSTGGWRYHPQPQDADISVTVMQIVALVSAKEAGIYVPKAMIDRAVAYVKRLQVRFTGGFGYTSAAQEGFARTAAGAMSLLMCGEKPESREVKAALGYLNRYPDTKFKDEQWFFYGHYYAVQAMYQAGDDYYQKWYPRIQAALLARQTKDGSWNGSEGGGQPYATAMAILILGVPYRYLPIYQR